MKAIMILKALTLIMGLLILSAFVVILIKVSESDKKIKDEKPIRPTKPNQSLLLKETASDQKDKAGIIVPRSETNANDIIVSNQHIPLITGEKITHLMFCRPYTCLLTSHPNGQRLLIVSQERGRLLHELSFNAEQ